MKKILLAGLLLCITAWAGAQKVYFIYLQSENGTPFFVKMGDKITSSTASGYCILPKLVDSTYQFALGKVGQAAGAEVRFSILINKKDRGFLVKEVDGKISLFDLQALTLTQPISSNTSSGKVIEKRTDPFTVLLAQAANDPSLLEVRAETVALVQPATVIAQPVVVAAKPSTETETIKEETSVQTGTVPTQNTAVSTPVPPKDVEPASTNTQTVVSTEPIKESVPETKEAEPIAVTNEAVYKPSIVTRRSESSTSEGFGLVFLDKSDTETDTIRILIPNQSSVLRKEETKEADSKKFLNISSVDTTKQDSSTATKKHFLPFASERFLLNTKPSKSKTAQLVSTTTQVPKPFVTQLNFNLLQQRHFETDVLKGTRQQCQAYVPNRKLLKTAGTEV